MKQTEINGKQNSLVNIFPPDLDCVKVTCPCNVNAND